MTLYTAVEASRYVIAESSRAASLNLLIENLRCAACVARIERGLKEIPGVIEARVNLSTARLGVRFDRAAVDAGALIGAIERLGYRAVPFDPESLNGGRAAENRLLMRSLAVAGFAAANVMLISVAIWAGAASGDLGPATREFLHWTTALIALPAIAYAGRPFYRSALAALAGGGLNMDVPISLAVLLAAGMSLHETVTGGAHAYFDAAVMLLFFLLIGRTLDRRARSRAQSAAEQMTLLEARSALVKADDGTLSAAPPAAVALGATVVVRPGDRVPVDGRVAAGRSTVDASLVTGESAPRDVAPGNAVYAGTINHHGALEVTVSARGGDTLLAEIARLMEAAEQGRARYVRLADRVARLYAPAVHGTAALAFLGWITLGGLAWQPALLIAVSVLIITCPCALGLAVPAVQVVAAGRLMRQGVLVRAGDALERLAVIDTVVFDKTGTLTESVPAPVGDTTALSIAASLASASNHPLARALAAAAPEAMPEPSVREVPGCGLVAEIDGAAVRLGTREWCGVDDAIDGDAGETWLARAGEKPVRFAFRDRDKADSAAVAAALKDQGLAVELLSGDRVSAVARTARRLGIARWRAETTPTAKVARLEALAAAGRKVLMVGDGLNDAPALAAAFVSASPARAADISRTAADVIIQGDRLAPLLELLAVARKSRHLVVQNFALALGYNVLAVPLAVAGQVTPLIAALAMSASSIVVTVNALRLARRP